MLTYPKNILESLTVDILKKLSRLIDLPKTLTRKDDLIRELARKVETDLPGILRRMPENERLLLAEAAYHQGHIDPQVFSAKYSLPCSLPDRWMEADKTGLTALMFQQTLLGIYEIPKELAQTLRGLLPQPKPAGITIVDPLPPFYHPPKRYDYHPDKPPRPIQVYEGEKPFFSELRRVLRVVQTGKVKVTDKGRRPTNSAVRLLSAALDSPDFNLEPPLEKTNPYEDKAGAVRAHAWGVLVQQCGWAKPRAGSLILTEAGKQMLNGADIDRYKAGAEAFFQNDDFDEINRIEHIRGQSGKARRYMTSPSDRKIPIVDSMALWPVNQWVSLEEAYRFVLASGNAFEITDHPYHLYFSEKGYGHFGDVSFELNLQYLRALLMEPLATLGMVDIAYVFPHDLWPELAGRWGSDDFSFCSRYDGLLYVRLTDLGAFVLGLRENWTPPEKEECNRDLFTILPNREIALTRSNGLSADIKAGLEMCAFSKNDFIWELSIQPILGYLESGGTMEEITAFLRSHSSRGIPETVEIFLRDVAKKCTAVQNGEEAFLFTVKDAATAALIAGDSEARKYCLLAGSNRLAVPKKNQRAFRTVLKKLGYIIPS